MIHKVLKDSDRPLGHRYRLIERIWKVEKSDRHPEGVEFTFQLLRKTDDGWIHALRIDNQLHEGKPGVHIHRSGYVEWKDMSIKEAAKMIRGYAYED